MTLTSILLIVVPVIILFFFLNMAARILFFRLREIKRLAEREEALKESLRMDFTRESKTLTRVEVEEPRARILCVDDEEVILDSFRKILVLDGYCVDTVETGQEALGLIQSRDYDFVFTDLKMPSMSGVDVAKSVKHMRPDIDVVIITGYASVESAVECMAHGAMDYVEKPFSEDELRMFTRKALIKRQDRINKGLKPQVNIVGAATETTGYQEGFTIPGGALVSGGHCWAAIGEDGSVRVGLDDFARRLIGRIDSIELPEPGKSVQAGEPLFHVRQGDRTAQFRAPIGGRITAVNSTLAGKPGALSEQAYGPNWICAIEADRLDEELSGLKIGKSAVALFQEDLDRFLEIVGKSGTGQSPVPIAFFTGALERLDDATWDTATRAFLAH
ncbi:MAG: response regulator [Xanthomonadales bacterium]|jgi:CheY-like chemotaxis protein|nr:response regulator [Xanthomonadales bacterium]